MKSYRCYRLIAKKSQYSIFTQIIYFRIQPGRFISLLSLNGTSNELLCLPLSPYYLHTCYYRLHSGFQLTEEDKKFAGLCWEIMNILKENFPSKIHLFQERMDLCRPYYNPLSISEELRRQISCLLSIKDEERPLTLDEMEDAFYTLAMAEKLADVRSQNVCLELLNTFGQQNLLQNFKNEVDTLTRIIERNDFSQLSSNRQFAMELMEKINNQQAQAQLNDTFQRQLNDINGDDTLSIISEQAYNQTSATIERPTSTRMCLFQLSESNDLNRVTLILETLSCRSKETLQQLRKKYQLNIKLIQVLKKYCNGDYGFDHISSRHGSFQHALMKLLIIISNDCSAFLEYLQTQTIDYLSQIIEEGIIFAYEDAATGTHTPGRNQDLFKFLLLALDFFELSIGKQFAEFISTIRGNLRKIQQRMHKLLQKKGNMLLNYFLQNYQAEPANVPQTFLNSQMSHELLQSQEEYQGQQLGLGVDQMFELKAISVGLYEFCIELNNRIQRIEALSDFTEKYEEKHVRLFYQFLTKKQNYGDEVKGNANTDIKKAQREVQFKEIQEQENYNANKQPQRVRLEPKEKLGYDTKVSMWDTNSRLTSQEMQRGYFSLDKENEKHFIGSPIKPIQQ